MAEVYLHRAVRPLLMTDEVVGGQHHLTHITVKTCFVPVLMGEEQKHKHLMVSRDVAPHCIQLL